MDVRRPDSTGLPLPNVCVKISDRGEILVKGDNVTPGYYNAPEETARAFEDGWYKTGDLGFFDDEGFLHIQGRVKDMIVLPSGQNVFPQDIQNILVKHPSVRDAVVLGLPRGTPVEGPRRSYSGVSRLRRPGRGLGKLPARRASAGPGVHRHGLMKTSPVPTPLRSRISWLSTPFFAVLISLLLPLLNTRPLLPLAPAT